MGIVFLTYYGLYLPSGVDSLLTYDLAIKHYVYRITNMLFFANALLNPLIYSGQSKDFNLAFRKTLGINRKHSEQLQQTNTLSHANRSQHCSAAVKSSHS